MQNNVKLNKRADRLSAIHRFSRSLICRIVLFVTSFCIAALASAEEPRRYALLIAVTRYQDATMDQTKLVYPEIDANEVGEFLSSHGYTVEYLLGRAATAKAIEEKLNNLAGKSDSEGVALIGLWGHGVEFSGTKETMFCPFDTSLRIATDADGKKLYNSAGKLITEPNPDSLIGLSDVLAGLQISGAGNRILLADCCRTSPNKARGRAFGQSVTAADLPDNTLAILACKPSQQAFEHEKWGHGAMTRALLDALPNVSNGDSDFALDLIGPMTIKVSRMVREVTGGRSMQTIHQISTGNPRLRLAVDRPQISLLPMGQSLTASEKASRRRKAEGELTDLGNDKQTAFVRGKLLGPKSLRFKLTDFEDDYVTYCRELATLKTPQYADMYWKRAAELRDFLRTNRAVRDSICDSLTKPDKYHVISAFRRYDIWENVPTMIRSLMSLTTIEERKKSLKHPIARAHSADKAFFWGVCGDASRIRTEDLGGSHTCYFSIPLVLSGQVEEAIQIARLCSEGLDQASLLLVADTLLDQGDREEAKRVFKMVDHSVAPAMLVGYFPLARAGFSFGGTYVGMGSLPSYIAGRLDDEAAFRAICKESSGNLPFGQQASRLSFIEGLTRDL